MGRTGHTRKLNYVVGFTSSHGLMLDLDRTTLREAKQLATYYNKRFKLQGYLIARSSPSNYHVIFNRYLTWPTVLEYLFKIVWHYHFHGHGSRPSLTNWAILQAVKHSCTLRIGCKGKKKPPKIIYRNASGHSLFPGKNSLIRDYLTVRQTVNGGEKPT